VPESTCLVIDGGREQLHPFSPAATAAAAG